MKIEKNRQMLIMYNLVHASGPVTAEELAVLSMSSVRTVKSDIVFLNESLSEAGTVRIMSHKARGYTIETENRDDLNRLTDELNIMYSLFYNRSIEGINRRMYILQRLLTDEYVTAEEISEKLYLTKSALRRDYAWAIRFLKSFRLEVVSSVGKGYHVSGKEQDIRSALVEVHCSQYHEFNPLYPYEPFNEQFYRDGKNIYPELRKTFLDILRSSDIVIYDIAGKKLATHLCLMQNRIRKGKKIEFSNDIADELRRTYDYEIARKILSAEIVRKYMDPDENEVLNFARMLLINRDIHMRQKGNDHLPLGLIIENLTIFNKVIQKARKQLGGQIYDLDIFKVYGRDLESLRMQMYLKNHFDYTDTQRMITYAEGREDNVSPIALEMARILIVEMEEVLKVTIKDETATFFAVILETIINKLDFPYNRRNIIVCSTNGLVAAGMLREKLLTNYAKYINTAEVYNFYELRKLDLTGYEVVMDSNLTMYNHYNTKVISYNNLDYGSNNRELFTELFRLGYDRDILEAIKKLITVSDNMDIRDLDTFIEALSYRYATDMDAREKMYERYLRGKRILDYYYSRTGIATIFIPREYTGRDFIDIFIPKDRVHYSESQEIKAVITISSKSDLRSSTLRILDNGLKYILQVSGCLDQVAADKNKALDRIYDVITTRDFYEQ